MHTRTLDYQKRSYPLDILRGIAILGVIFAHADIHTIPGWVEPSSGWLGAAYWKIHQLGWTGVDLFFIISGFLIGGGLINQLEQHGSINLKVFWLKRAVKILPSYLVMILTVVSLGIVDVSWGEIYKFIFFLQNYLAPTTIGPTWSLAVEEHFYILLPILLTVVGLLAKRRGLNPIYFVPYIVLGILLLSMLSRFYQAATVGVQGDDFMMSHFRFDSLFFGVSCYYIWHFYGDTLRRYMSWLWVLFALSLLTVPWVWSRNDDMMFFIGFLMLSLAYSMLLLYVLEHGFGRFGDSYAGRSVAQVGKWSYNIYLWQFFLIGLNPVFYVDIQLWLASVLPSLWLQVVLQVTVAVFYSIAIGWLGTILIENTFMRLRKYFV